MPRAGYFDDFRSPLKDKGSCHERGDGPVMDQYSGVSRLSPRQQQILILIIKGCNNKAIARVLGIEVVTVKMHVGRLFKKLGVTNRTRAGIIGAAVLYEVDSGSATNPSAAPNHVQVPLNSR
jgi:DNA-binding CsgD family transcriptional regulator